jgi:hypothetical protein
MGMTHLVRALADGLESEIESGWVWVREFNLLGLGEMGVARCLLLFNIRFEVARFFIIFSTEHSLMT